MNGTTVGPAVPEVDNGNVCVANRVPVQLVPEYTLNVTVPVGLKPEETVAVSLAELPTIMVVAERDVLNDGVAVKTFNASQVLDTLGLFASPL